MKVNKKFIKKYIKYCKSFRKGNNMENLKCMFCEKNIGTDTIEQGICDTCLEYTLVELLKLCSYY